ncbi:hypothetical protein EV424DRAFT_1352741 [Suillus variegatus]|nr:hypothetical protein EV424DRAFT_1352741 [Suillus variegatus]
MDLIVDYASAEPFVIDDTFDLSKLQVILYSKLCLTMMGYIGLPSSRVDVARPSSAQLNSPENRQTLASYICAIVVYFVMIMGHKAGSVYVKQFLCVPGVNEHSCEITFLSWRVITQTVIISGLVCQRVYTRSSEVRFTTKVGQS